MSEKQEQIALFRRAQFHPITRDFMWASANGGSRYFLEAISLKRQGVKPGIPDIQLAYPVGKYHGLFIELKRAGPRKGKLTADQVIWIKRLSSIGYAAYVADGWEEAWSQIMDYLGGIE